MNTSVFSISSFVVYLLGILTGREAIAIIFGKPIASIISLIPPASSNKLLFTMMEFIASNLTFVFICILILIGVKFYWFAEHVDRNKNFQKLLEKNNENLKLDYCLRVLWVLPPLSLPAILLGDIFVGLEYKITILFVMFILMFFANIIWSWLFLGYLETISVGLTSGRKVLILLPDAISAFAFGFGLIGSYLITIFEVPVSSTYLIFFVCCAIASIFITLQLLVFVPGVIARKFSQG